LNRRGFDDPGAEFRGVAQARHRPRRLHHRPRWNRALRGLGRPRQLRADTNTVTVAPPITPHPNRSAASAAAAIAQKPHPQQRW